jgi:hypothetical protein
VTGYGAAILQQHAALLEASAISPEVAKDRGYVSVDTKKRLEAPGFKDYQRRVPGLLIPLRRADGSVWGHQFRPDKPRSSKDRVIKYETPAGQPNGLDVPLRARDALADPAVTLFITEGSRKADAAVTAGLACVSLSGVWAWRGTNGQGGKRALADWHDVSLNGRRVVLAFDSDAAVKESVGLALAELAGYLTSKGARVDYLHLPDEGDGKTGLDDFLAARPVGDLWPLVRPDAPVQAELPAVEPAAPSAPLESATAATAAPWDGDPAALLDEVHSAYTKYVIFPSEETADAITLYTAATHAQSAWEHATRLVIKSPIKRCGKTRAQEVARELVHKALPTTNISPAALARSISQEDPPTLILDEADTVWGKKEQRSEGAEDLRGILNAGHSRGWPYVRWDASARQKEECPTFAMAIIGGIGDMPDTIEDRAVIISMRRRAPGEQVTQWRTRRAVPVLSELRGRLHAWVTAQNEILAHAEPDLPAEDRAADVWEPLVAIADAAGGSWPDRARKACQVITGAAAEDPRDGTAGERLLADLRPIFADATFLYSATITRALAAIEEAPWAEWRRTGAGREPINGRGLADLLKPWGIRSRNGREGGTGSVGKGYYAEDMADAWSRYSRYSATDDESAQVSDVAEPVADDPDASATGADLGQSADVADVADVADYRLEGVCTICGEPLDPALAEAGFTDHGEREAR